MTTLRRLAVWLIETCCQAVLMMLLVMILSGRSEQRTIVEDLSLAFFGTVIVFMIGSGYLLTTAVSRVFLSRNNPWVYPPFAAVLFVAHEQFLFSGWKLPDGSHVQTQMFGACIAFICTLIGGLLLRRWTLSSDLKGFA